MPRHVAEHAPRNGIMFGLGLLGKGGEKIAAHVSPLPPEDVVRQAGGRLPELVQERRRNEAQQLEDREGHAINHAAPRQSKPAA